MSSFGVVEVDPLIQIGLQGFDSFVELLAECDLIKLLQDCFVEAFANPVGLGRSYEPRDEPLQWDWSVRSCNHENRFCRYIIQVIGSHSPWPVSFVTENGQTALFPGRGDYGPNFSRAVMIEYGDYDGVMDHSEWFGY